MEREFRVFKNGREPKESEFISFASDFLGIVQWSTNFSPKIDYYDYQENYVYGLETTLYSERELDSFSMDWEFIQIK